MSGVGRPFAVESITAIVAQAFDCADALASVIAAKAVPRSFAARTTILFAGDKATHIYVLVEGHAQAIAVSPDGRSVLVEDFEAGDFFGEGAVLASGVVGEDVMAVNAVLAGQFRADVFIGLMETYASVALAVSRLILARLTRTTRRMVEGVTLSANGRVHAELLRLARAQGAAMQISPAPRLTAIAMHAQTTRETVSRAISVLEKKGIIRRDKDALTIVAPHRLEDLVV